LICFKTLYISVVEELNFFVNGFTNPIKSFCDVHPLFTDTSRRLSSVVNELIIILAKLVLPVPGTPANNVNLF
jgi:hypothetical protein